ncbi:MAG: oxygen-independent coproporphyrinogen III oxidase [Bacteroidetes bacterium]|nr:oxygen-independent coproporphyrinogen III oxidase [Bacteroidota bacterium]
MSLIAKYNVPVPRYTSYPTVPFWDNQLNLEQWENLVKQSFQLYNKSEGISLYIHLPYCESLCTYCACNTRITVNHGVEEPYINAVLQEWKMYVALFNEKPRIKEIHLGGGTPTFFSAENLSKLIKGIFAEAEICEEHSFSFEGHPGNTLESHLQTLFDLGFDRVSYGIQDFDDKVQVAINRHQSFEEVLNVVELSRKIGYTSINFDLVYGLPFQTAESVTDTLEQVISLKPDRIAFYSYAHVPWIKPGQRRFTEMDLPEEGVKRNLYEIGLTYFSKAGYLEVGMDHFALPNDELFASMENKKLHRNFMGYTASRTDLMIGLGVSSISDSWTGFAQNLKTVEEYIACVKENKIPVFRGHALTEQDLFLRKHILNVMCNLETTFSVAEFGQEMYDRINKRLQEVKEDKLVEITQNKLIVTQAGKTFLRNICMCFDERYHQREVKEEKFSKAI